MKAPSPCLCGHSLLRHDQVAQPDGHPMWVCFEPPADPAAKCVCPACKAEDANRCACRRYVAAKAVPA